jgi:hypothetical protein
MQCRGFTGVYRGLSLRRFTRTAEGAFTPGNIVYVVTCLALFGTLRLVNVSVILGNMLL